MKVLIKTKNWEDEDQNKIIDLVFEQWKNRRSNITLEQTNNWFKRLDLENTSKSITATINDELIGWLLFVKHSNSEAEINPWALNGHPILSKESRDQIETSSLLLKEAIKQAEKEQVHRLELSFMKNIPYNLKNEKIYTSLGMRLIEQTCHMRQNLENFSLPEINIPAKFKITPISQISKNDFYKCFYNVFRTSEDEWMLDKSDSEIKDHFESDVYNNHFELISDASICLIDNGGNLMAFTVLRKSHGEKNGHIWIIGVDTNYRKQGIGRNLLNLVKSKLIEMEYKSISLNVNLTNKPAYDLYCKTGFQEEWIQYNYAWTNKITNLK
ncbi:MAG TPA: GNAT family N-acetyltransferase [candidate division Zixibacteria bacterium]|nr:GNAT family N-acetyltransferase [candidate division Zixibacteria bacterium]